MGDELATVSLTGDRAENQDRVHIISEGGSILLIVADGMGGHAEGGRASEVTIACLERRFRDIGQPVLDPQGFLIMSLAAAHDAVVALGAGIPLEQRPRATCAVCLVQDSSAYIAHIGDSRVYQLRRREILHRSRDHSHVELLLHEGVIEEREVADHPMRNLVECCLGGDEPLPDMAIAARCKLAAGDVLLLCSDGLWTGIGDDDLLALTESTQPLPEILQELSGRAVESNSPTSDNTTAAAVRIGKAD